MSTKRSSNGVQNEEKKAKVGSAPTHITLKVKGQDEEAFRVFSVKRNVEMRKVMEYYNDVRGVEWGTFVFVSNNGSRIREYHIPDELELKEGDQIDAMLRQGGGFGPSSITF